MLMSPRIILTGVLVLASAHGSIGGRSRIRLAELVERTGDLSGLGLAFYDPASGPTPATRTPFTGAMIPANKLSTQPANSWPSGVVDRFRAAANQVVRVEEAKGCSDGALMAGAEAPASNPSFNLRINSL